MKKLIRTLRSEIEDKINNINCGGCGVFAYYMAKRLEKFNISYKILIRCDGSEFKYFKSNNKFYTQKKYRNIDKNILAPNHFKIYLPNDKLIFDAEGYYSVNYTPDEDDIFPGTLKFLKYSIEKGTNWNSDYDRQQNPKVRKIINKVFNERSLSKLS